MGIKSILSQADASYKLIDCCLLFPGASSQQEVLAANKPPASSASRVQHDKQPAVSDQTPKKTESGNKADDLG